MTLPLKDINAWRSMPLPVLMDKALRAKLAHRGRSFSFCGIVNARSGGCSEDCRFCAQSGRFKTAAPVYPLMGMEEILAAAHEAKQNGAGRFSIVTSGRGLSGQEVDRVADMIYSIKTRVGIKTCASLGILGSGPLKKLKDAGLLRYHHNLETSEEFFPRVVGTHGFRDRINTIEAAKKAGLEVCAGGIIGLGETEADRVSMALSLKELDVDSVPLNILIPLPGTPLHGTAPLAVPEILRTIALYRLIIQDKPIRLAAGRESVLGDFLGLAFMAGADGLMIGGYLTQRGRPAGDDLNFARQMQEIWNV